MAVWFGTSGWRAVNADKFTFAGARTVVQAICEYLPTSGAGQGGALIVIYDTRFLGERFAAECIKEVSVQEFRALLFSHPTPTISYAGGVACFVVMSHRLVDRVADARGLPVYETSVDLKFNGELINEDKIILGGEESAGMSIKGHYPKKDGILACLLAAAAVAARGASLSGQFAALYRRVGRIESGSIGGRWTPELDGVFPGEIETRARRDRRLANGAHEPHRRSEVYF